MSNVTELEAKLRKLRIFDSIVDFSRSKIQLDIVLILAFSKRPLSIDDISSALGHARKPLLDAIRKLEIKGIVKRESKKSLKFELTGEGKKLVNELMDVLGAPRPYELGLSRKIYGKVGARDIIKFVIPARYLYEALVTLGTSRKASVKLSTLSEITGISQHRLSMYLDLYSGKGSTKLFEKKRKTSRFSSLLRFFGYSKRKNDVEYTLTSSGMEVFKNTPTYYKIKRNAFARIVTKVFGNYSPKYILRKLSIMDLALFALLLAITLISDNPFMTLVTAVSILLVKTAISLMLLFS